MLLYNVTTIVEEEIAGEWLAWMQDTHVTEIMETGKFVSHRLLKVLDSPNEGVTYCAQFIAESKEDYDAYINIHAPALRASVQEKFQHRAVSFRTLMEFVG